MFIRVTVIGHSGIDQYIDSPFILCTYSIIYSSYNSCTLSIAYTISSKENQGDQIGWHNTFPTSPGALTFSTHSSPLCYLNSALPRIRPWKSFSACWLALLPRFLCAILSKKGKYNVRPASCSHPTGAKAGKHSSLKGCNVFREGNYAPCMPASSWIINASHSIVRNIWTEIKPLLFPEQIDMLTALIESLRCTLVVYSILCTNSHDIPNLPLN